ncbi:hypothetical protein JL2886_02862 [Phaeobacter gallaeciensis]|uniref:Uncharacterized protein n=1 Tax=Phaeobacter gallaeciensis TaxID=60890 RepID=A0A1B0ZUH5_9RHOB|nr:hypothetical protein JL2886_02862 [Phaeobacter gallaeciensis]
MMAPAENNADALLGATLVFRQGRPAPVHPISCLQAPLWSLTMGG